MIMKVKYLIVFLLVGFIIFPPLWAEELSPELKNASEEKRKIFTLSDEDIEELKNGRAWGLAKAAELNGAWGPRKVLELKNDLKLSSNQIRKIEDHYDKTKRLAIQQGIQLIELEGELNHYFNEGILTEPILRVLISRLVRIKSKLFFIHLSAHLKTQLILNTNQQSHYNKLRGVSSN